MRTALLALALLVLGSAPAPASPQAPSGLRGAVSLYPARPVCAEDDPCTKPARGVVLLFSRNGRVASRVTTTAAGTYRVLLAPGRYTVSAPRLRVGSGVTPREVRVPAGRVARLHLRIDSGLQ